MESECPSRCSASAHDRRGPGLPARRASIRSGRRPAGAQPRRFGRCLVLAIAALLAPAAGEPQAAAQATDEVCADARQAVEQLQPRRVAYGFYTDFDPLSYAATQDPSDSAFHRPLGYEPALVVAVEIFAGGRLIVEPVGISNPFDGIWLAAAEPRYDLVGGGITRLDGRTRDATGRQVVVGHLGFRQSLLVRAESDVVGHCDLTAGRRVGALRGTTGEIRLLALTGITGAQGFIRAGTRIQVADGTVLTAGGPDGRRAWRIAGAAPPEAIATRVRLSPPGDRPEVVYYDSEAEQIEAVLAGDVDAVARGEIGNLIAARERRGLRVTALDDGAREHAAFSYPGTSEGDALRETMDAVIRCLTDDGTVAFADWQDSGGALFARRAEERR